MRLTPFETAFMLHLIADWLLQNEWMAVNKVRLSHPAAWVHGAIHAVLLGLVVGWAGGIILGLLHILVDTRVPIRYLIKHFKKCEKSPEDRKSTRLNSSHSQISYAVFCLKK